MIKGEVKRKQVKFPRSKSRRIRKKWAKDQRNYVYDPEAYYLGNPHSRNVILLHPVQWAHLSPGLRAAAVPTSLFRRSK